MTVPSVSMISLALLALVDALAIFRAVTRDHGVERTLAWVFGIIALPGVGALAYFLLASPSVRRTTERKRVTAAAVRETMAGRPDTRKIVERTFEPGTTERGMLHLATALTGIAPSTGNEVELMTKKRRSFELIEEAINSATRSIWAEYYIIRNDETGHRFLELLARRAREGIEVRLLFDAVGSIGLDAGRLRAIRQGGGRAKVFLPVNPLRRRWSVHLRNHRKLVIVDGSVGFTGGMNVGDEYSGRSWRRGVRHRFHDSHLEVRGPAVADLAQIFAEDWSFGTGEPLEPPPPPAPIEGGAAVVAMVPSGPDQKLNAIGFTYFAGIASARQRVYLTSPYFIPDDPTTHALISAAMRGVDVRILVPRDCDIRIVASAARSYYKTFIDGGVRVFEYLPAMLHAKTMVVDASWGVVGSANVDIRSFRLNFELGAMVLDRDFAALLEARFLEDLARSEEVTEESLAARGPLPRIRDKFTRLLSPLL